MRLGWEEHAPNRGRSGTAEILGGLQASQSKLGLHTILFHSTPF